MVAAQDGAMDGNGNSNGKCHVKCNGKPIWECLSLYVCVCLCVLFGQLAAPEQPLTRHDNWAAGDLWLTRV